MVVPQNLAYPRNKARHIGLSADLDEPVGHLHHSSNDTLNPLATLLRPAET